MNAVAKCRCIAATHGCGGTQSPAVRRFAIVLIRSHDGRRHVGGKMPKILNKRTRSTVCLGSDNERHNLDTMIISSHSQYLIQNTMFCKLARRISLVSLSLKRRASTNAARWKEEPVHEDAFTIVVRIVSQESMPLVFLFATAISITATSARF